MLLASGDPLHTRILGLLAVVVGTGLGVQWLAARLRIPALVPLLVSGIVLGPLLGIVRPAEQLGAAQGPLVSAAVALVLFEGGLSLRFREARMAGAALGRLILAGLLVGSILVGLLAWMVVGLDPATSAVLGAILVVTGPTVIQPLLRQARIAQRPATLLKWEGIVNDPLGAVLAVVVFQIATAAPTLAEGVSTLLPQLLLNALLALGVGTAAGVLMGLALRRGGIPDHLHSPVLLASVLVVHAGVEHLGEEGGLLAVTAMGLVLANEDDASIEEIRHFKEQISVLLVSILFVVLSASLRVDDLEALAGAPLLLVLAVMFVVRPAVIGFATVGTAVSWRERLLLTWVAPRGVVAAAVAGAFSLRLRDAGHEDARLLVPIVFGVILTTVILQGLTTAPLARRLGLSVRDGTGLLIVGASSWGLALGEALTRAGARVILADTRYNRVSRARRRGQQTWFGDVLGEDSDYDLPLEQLSWVLAATDDDSYNALVCVEFARDLGKERTVQLTPEIQERDRREAGSSTRGVTPWGAAGSYKALAAAFWARQQFKVTRLSEEYTLEDLMVRNPRAVLLFAVDDGRVAPLDPEIRSKPAGTRIVWLEEKARWLWANTEDEAEASSPENPS